MKFPKTTARALALSALFTTSLAMLWAQNATLFNWVLVNNTRTDVVAIYMVRSGSANWGKDFLEKKDTTFDSGERFTFHVSTGEYDLKLVTENEAVCQVKNFQVTRSLTWNFTNDWMAKNCR